MESVLEFFSKQKSLHHAYCIQGDRPTVRTQIFEVVEKHMKHPTQANPDFWHGTFDVFTVDDARELGAAQAMRPVRHEKRVFLIETHTMTMEAQNALLKIFEEPASGVHFFLSTPSAEILLPTLRSRMVVISSSVPQERGRSEAAAFIDASFKKRLAMVAEMVEAKDKAAAAAFMDALIVELSRKKKPRPASLMHEILSLRSYLADRSPSVKLILEYIALILPQ